MKQCIYWASALAGALMLVPVFAQDHADIDKSQIIGNRELPKVLYIVPWKKPVPGDLSGKPLQSVIDEALAPVDKDVFQREVKYQTPIEPAKKEQLAADKKPVAIPSNTK
jgi:hypothetical protein